MSDLIKLTGLWENTSQQSGNRYLAGYLGRARLLVFKNREKQEEKDPDWVLFLAPGKEQRERQGDRPEREPASARESRAPADGWPPRDEEVPF